MAVNFSPLHYNHVCEHTLHHEPTQEYAHTKAKIHFTTKHHRALRKSSARVWNRLRSLEVFYTRGSGCPNVANNNTYHILHVSVLSAGRHELWIAHIHSKRHDRCTAVGNKAYCHRPGTRLNFRFFADHVQMANVSAYSVAVMRVYRVCWELSHPTLWHGLAENSQHVGLIPNSLFH